MYCQRCGSELEAGSKFCHKCGEMVNADHNSSSTHTMATGGRRGGTVIKAVLIVAILCLASLIVIGLVTDSGDSRTYTIGDVTITEGLNDDVILVDPSGTIAYTGIGSDVSWFYKDLFGTSFVKTSSGIYENRAYMESRGAVLDIGVPGQYSVMLYVDGERRNIGTVTLDGMITERYTWQCSFDGIRYTFNAEYSFTFDEFRTYADMDVIRRGISSLSDTRFVVVDDSILRLSDVLAESYRKVFGQDASISDQNYADFLTSFVQCEFDYPDMISKVDGVYREDPDGNGDLFLFGTEEYWAYPMETIYHGMGDCEDTTFLLSALFSAAGYKSAVASMPGHMLAAVVLDPFSERQVPQMLKLTAKTLTQTNEPLYFCETTYDAFTPAGYVYQSEHDDIMALREVTIVKPYARA